MPSGRNPTAIGRATTRHDDHTYRIRSISSSQHLAPPRPPVLLKPPRPPPANQFHTEPRPVLETPPLTHPLPDNHPLLSFSHSNSHTHSCCASQPCLTSSSHTPPPPLHSTTRPNPPFPVLLSARVISSMRSDLWRRGDHRAPTPGGKRGAGRVGGRGVARGRCIGVTKEQMECADSEGWWG